MAHGKQAESVATSTETRIVKNRHAGQLMNHSTSGWSRFADAVRLELSGLMRFSEEKENEVDDPVISSGSPK